MAGSGREMANVNFSRYSSAVFLVAKTEVWRVFDWLHRHHYRRQPQAHVEQRLRESKGGMDRLGAKEKEALSRKDDPANMDIPLLYRLLQHTCGLRRDGPEFNWSKPRGEEERHSLEHRLYLVKEARNNLCHQPDQYMHLSDHRLQSLLQELRDIICHSLRQAGRLSERPTEEVEKCVADVGDRLDHIQASVPPSAILPQEFGLLARSEVQRQREDSGSGGQRLSPPLLRWALGAQVVTLDRLLQGPEGQEKPPRVLAVVGEPGIGKSSLCWQVVDAWLKGEAGLGEAVAEMEVVVVVEVRRVFTSDLTRLLLHDLLPQTCRRCHPEEVLGLLKGLRVLWLLDGFEEALPEARELLQRLVEWSGSSDGGHAVVVTCQPEYREELHARLDPSATPCYAIHCGLTEQGFHSLLATLLQGGQEAPADAGEGREIGREAGGGGRERVAEGEGRESRSKSGEEEVSGEDQVRQRETEGRRRSKEMDVEARREAFLREVMELDPNLQMELSNPLKLELAVRLWEEGRLGEAAGAPLTRLYATIQDALVAKLVARLRNKSLLTEAEARERVRRWVAALCRVALAMWGRGRFMALDEAAEQLLKERAIQLLLPYTDCFSTFLVCRGGTGPKYCFLHHTQQSILASQHLHTLMLEDCTSQELQAIMVPGQATTTTTTTTTTSTSTSTTTTSATTTITTTTTDTTTNTTTTIPTDTTAVNTTTTTTIEAVTAALGGLSITAAPASTPTTLDHFQEVLVHVATSLATEGSLSEGRARVLAELLEQCRHCPWLEVVSRTAYCPAMAREVRPRLTELWKVTGPAVQAAAVLADICAPAGIIIELHDDPGMFPHLMPLLQCLAKAPVAVALHNNHSINPFLPPTPSDSLLVPLCDPASLCRLTVFAGVLTAEGCRTLQRQQHNLIQLLVGVLEPTTLKELIRLTHKAEQLQEMIIYLFSIFRDLPRESVPLRVRVDLYMVKVGDKEAEDAVVLARCISHTFRRIMLGQISPAAVCRMVRAFKKERVRAQSLGRAVVIKIITIIHTSFIPFFPLPLPTDVSLKEVYKAWDRLELRVTTEVKVMGNNTTHTDTPPAQEDSH